MQKMKSIAANLTASRRSILLHIAGSPWPFVIPIHAEARHRPDHYDIDPLEIIVPANPGGGSDQTARAMQSALQRAGVVSQVQVQNVPGAGGTIGLAQFITRKAGEGDTLLVGGSAMMGAILTNNSPVKLSNATPLARLTGEYQVIVVPVESPIQSMKDLVTKLREDPSAVSWAGGSAGGTDQVLTGLIAKAAGVDPMSVNYIAHSGGNEALSTILGGDVTAGVSGYPEFAPQIATGNLRGLALSSDVRLPSVDLPTLKEQNIDVSLVNWRGLFAPPQVDEAEKMALSEAIAKMVESAEWQETLKTRGWLNLYLPASEFSRFLAEDEAKITDTIREIGLVP